jgi:hypothetical protein
MPTDNIFIGRIAYNNGTKVDSALNTGNISLAVNNSVNFNTLNWCASCGVCNEYIIITDSYFMGKTTLENAQAICYCTGSLDHEVLLYSINRLALTKSEGPFNTLEDAMDWVETNGIFITNQNYPSIVTDGNVLHLDGGLPASYPLVGTSWYDLTENSNNGVLINGVTYNSSVKGHLGFNGSNQYVSVSGNTNIPVGNSNYTIGVWFSADTLGDKGLVGWGNYGTTNEVNAFRLTSNGLTNYWWTNDLSVTTTITPGNWYYAVATFDGTTRSIYVNGVLVGSDTPTGHNVPNSTNLTIGVTNSTEYFDGSIADVQIFDRAITPTEILQNYNSFVTRYNGDNTEICLEPFLCSNDNCITLVSAIQVCNPGDVTITYTVSPYNPLATGFIDDNVETFQTKTIIVPIGTNLFVTANATNGSSFIGWSTNQSIFNVLTSNPILVHIAEYDITYYAVIDKTGVVARSFCYFVSGSTIDDACLDCSETSTVYFDSDDYYTNSIENITWYNDEGLTQTVPNGLYKINTDSSITALTIYSLTNGVATVLGVCGSDPLTCCD